MNNKESEERPRKIRSGPLTGLFVLALLYTAYLSRAILLPIVLALFFTILLRPVTRFLKRLKIPNILSAAVILIFFLAASGSAIALLSGPAEEWIEKARQNFQHFGEKIKSVVEPAQETIEKMQGGGNKPKEPAKELSYTGALISVVTGVQEFGAKSAVMLILLFFLLAAGDLLLVKFMNLLPEYRDKKQAALLVQEVEHAVSRYLLTVTMINATQGLLITVAMYFLGMPNPLLWGVMSALLIYIPYIGPFVGISIVAIAAAFTFPSAGKAILAPGIYAVVEILQGQFVTPYILGARFTMSPLVVFLWLIIWGWFWGVVGALIAVPMLVIFKIVCDHVEPLKPLGEFLSD